MTDQHLESLLAAFSGRLHAFSMSGMQEGWRLAFPPFDAVTIHFVLRGTGWVRLGTDGAWHPFGARSLIIVPPHHPHALGDPTEDGQEVLGGDSCRPFGDGLVLFTAGNGRQDILMTCGCILRQEGQALGLAELLGDHGVEELGEAHRHVFDLMLNEIEQPSLGLQAMTEALMQQCLVLLVRRRLLREHTTFPLSALSHPQLAHAVLAILRDPAGPHSLESLAALADKFLGNLKMLAGTTDRLEGVKEVMSTVLRGVNTALQAVGIESTKIASLGGAPNVDPLGETYYSVTPFRYGDYIAKFSVAPVAPALLALKDKEIDATDRPDAIRETVQSEMQGIDGVWEFRVQLCRDLEKRPVEDPTVEWDEAEAPFQTVATITVPRQDSWDAARVRAVNEEMHFMIWTGLAAHQPLGNINRARREAYLHSTRFRERFNGCPVHEPGARAGA